MAKLLIILVLLTLIENIYPHGSSSIENQMEDFPLTRSLGYSIRKKLGRTLEDAKLNQEYMEQYGEMMRLSQESFESVDEREESRLRRVVGNDNLDVAKEGRVSQDRRRSASRLGSPVGQRRARSQALRRRKLNSQSLRSHVHHTRHLNRDNID